jgi:hypothetical protein
MRHYLSWETDTRNIFSFYVQYLAHWPEYFQFAESPSGEIMGYIMGKAEGHGENWHGHMLIEESD